MVARLEIDAPFTKIWPPHLSHEVQNLVGEALIEITLAGSSFRGIKGHLSDTLTWFSFYNVLLHIVL